MWPIFGSFWLCLRGLGITGVHGHVGPVVLTFREQIEDEVRLAVGRQAKLK